MDFELSEEQRAYRDAVGRFAAGLATDIATRDPDHEFSRVAWDECARFGIQGLPVPVELGGQGADPLTTALALEALGYGCEDNGLLFSINAHLWSCQLPILRFGTGEQKRRYLPGLCDGSLIGVQAMTEPDSGSDAFAMAMSLTVDGDDVVLDGTKTYITNAPVADVFVVFAKQGRGSGIGAISAVLVDRDTPGVRIGPPFRKMGLRTSPMSEVVFEGCRVPSSQLLGGLGAGLAVFNTSMDWERSFILATGLGTAARHLDRSVAYAKERSQFGQPIAKFQAVSHRLVDMRVRLEAAQLLLYRLAWKKSTGRATGVDSAIVKLFLSDVLVESSLDALRLHGAYGYLEESGIERDVRDALASRIYSGTSDIQRNIVAGRMGL